MALGASWSASGAPSLQAGLLAGVGDPEPHAGSGCTCSALRTTVRCEVPSPLALTPEGLLDGQPHLNPPLQVPTTQPVSGPGGVPVT